MATHQQMDVIIVAQMQIMVKESLFMGKNQHVTPHYNGGWQVKGDNNLRATAHTKTQSEAISIAKEIARNQKSELVIHGTDGRIREKDSYGNDKFPPRG